MFIWNCHVPLLAAFTKLHIHPNQSLHLLSFSVWTALYCSTNYYITSAKILCSVQAGVHVLSKLFIFSPSFHVPALFLAKLSILSTTFSPSFELVLSKLSGVLSRVSLHHYVLCRLSLCLLFSLHGVTCSVLAVSVLSQLFMFCLLFNRVTDGQLADLVIPPRRSSGWLLLFFV